MHSANSSFKTEIHCTFHTYLHITEFQTTISIVIMPDVPNWSIGEDDRDVEVQRLVADNDDSDTDSQLNIAVPKEENWTPPPSFMWMQVAIMTNVFLGGFDSTITASTYAVISSEFDSANTASWLTTSYLVTSAAFQPLYGRVSDILGRRVCFFLCTVTFALGCLGCGVAPNVLFLNCMRALAGFGGGGLMTMGKY